MLLGYFEFALLLFFPGFATLLLFNQIKGSNMVTVLARSYGISLALNAVLVFSAIIVGRTSTVYPVISGLGVRMQSLAPAILGASILLILLLALIRYGCRITSVAALKLEREKILVLVLGIVFAILVLSQFVKYPIFPKSYSVDFIQHVYRLKEIVISKDQPSAGILYYGVHYNLALGYMLVGGDPFVQIQYLMGILVAPSALLVYEAGRRIYSNEKFGILAQFLFLATGFLWYVPLYDTGLYPNIFAIILSFAFIIELRNAIDDSHRGRFVSFVMVAIGLYLSHYFSVSLIIAAFLSLVLAGGLKLVGWKRLAVPLIILLAPSGLLAIRPDVLNAAQQIYSQQGASGFFTFATPLADVFSFNPFLRYAIAIIFNYGSIVLLFGLPLAILYAWKNRRESWPLPTLIFWFFIMWVLAPNAELAWRFAFEGLAPILLLGPAVFSMAPNFVKWALGLGPSREGKRRRFRKREYAYGDVAIVIVMLLMVVGGSWTTIMVGDLVSNTSSYSAAQSDLYDSMTWFAQNTPPQRALLSVTDWRIAFLVPITGRNAQLLLLAPGPDALTYAKNNNYDYILVTYFIPASVPPTLDLAAYYNSFSQNQNLTVVYQNQYDIIYRVLK